MSSGIVLGFITGLIYGLLAVGIVLIFKANRFINLAHAQIGALSALLLGRLVLEEGWSWWAAFPVVVAVGALIGLLIERVVVRPMLRRRRNTVSLLLVTIGVSQLLLALTFVQGLGPSTNALYRSGYPVPFHANINAGSFVLGGQHIVILILVPLVVIALTVFLRATVWGKAIRAASSNSDAARLCGISVAKASLIAWGMAGALSAVTAVLQAPSQGSFNAAALGPGLLLRSLGAAALGGFTSIPAALIGGLIIGESEHIALAITHRSGPAELVVLLVVVVILFARSKVIGRSLQVARESFEDPPRLRIPEAIRSRPLIRWAVPGASALALAVGLLVPVMPFFHTEAHRFQLVITLTMAITGVALTMLLGWSGQVSLGHFAVLGLGGYLAAKLEPHGLSLLAILAVAALIGGATMALVGLPALRLQGLTLTLTTLGFALVAPAWLFHQPWLGAQGQSAVIVHPPGVAGFGRLGSQLSIYYAALVMLAVAMLAAVSLRRSLPGRLVVAVRDNDRAVASFGVVPATVKLSVLAVSGGFAAMAGVLWAVSWRTVSVDLVRPESSLLLLAIPVIGGLGSVGGAVGGALFVYLPAFFLSPLLTSVFGSFGKQLAFQLALGGIGLVVMPLLYPEGLAGLVRNGWQRFIDRVAAAVSTAEEPDERPLVVAGVVKRFGPSIVLDDVGIEVGRGKIVGLIGPNGAGKTTLMNVIFGDLSAEGGDVSIFGRNVTRLAPEYRAHLGVGRNYQEATLFPGLTIRESLQVALSRNHRVGVLSVMVRAPWVRHSERRTRELVDDIITRLGLEPWADSLIGELSTGTRRICELAAQLASRPRLLLLDEPTAGIAQREAEAFGPLLRRIRDELDCSILIIEHDMPMLMGVCDSIYALDQGRVIANGTPEEIRHDPRVIASYLGTTEVAVARSGRLAGAR